MLSSDCVSILWVHIPMDDQEDGFSLSCTILIYRKYYMIFFITRSRTLGVPLRTGFLGYNNIYCHSHCYIAIFKVQNSVKFRMII